LGNWLTPLTTVSDSWIVRTTFPSTRKVRVLGCQLICRRTRMDSQVAFLGPDIQEFTYRVLVVDTISVSQVAFCLPIRCWSWEMFNAISLMSDDKQLTNDALPEIVRLTLCSGVAREFPVNFILHVAHRDECCHYACPAAGLH